VLVGSIGHGIRGSGEPTGGWGELGEKLLMVGRALGDYRSAGIRTPDKGGRLADWGSVWVASW